MVRGFSATGLLARIVVDNGSTDRTADRARDAGAEVVLERRRGYGRACLTGIAAARAHAPEVIAFADGDGACDPADLAALLAPLDRVDLVIGSRVDHAQPGALTPPQRFGNALAVQILRRLYASEATDLGPFRAIRLRALDRLAMEDESYGWTVEMQLKAAKLGLRVEEVAVQHLRRKAGRSKISGTVRGVVGAGHIILRTLIRHY